MKLILIVFCVVLGLYLFSKLNPFKDYDEFFSTPISAKDEMSISNSSLKKSEGHFTISTWIFIDDWNYKYGEEKIILKKEIDGGNIPYIALDHYKNDLIIKVSGFKGEGEDEDEGDGEGEDEGDEIADEIADIIDVITLEPIVIQNIAMQKWVNIITSVNNNTIDVYINGKLVKTTTFNNVIDLNAFNEGNISVTPDGGFGGFLSRIRYLPYFITPENAWSIYTDGFGDAFESALNKYLSLIHISDPRD